MHITDWLWIKLIGGAIIVGLISFFYHLSIGRSLGADLHERKATREQAQQGRLINRP